MHCSKGTYVRALVRDLGELAGCGAYCDELRRTASGPLDIAHAGSLDEVEDSPTDGRWALSPVAALAHLPVRELAPAEQEADGPRPFDPGARVRRARRAASPVAACVCVAEPIADALRPKVVLEPAA